VRPICFGTIALALLCTCGEEDDRLPLSEVRVLIDEAAQCEPGEACALTPEMLCLCPQAVTANRLQEVLDALARVDCKQELMAKCTNFGNVRCEAGRCLRDALFP